MITKFSDQLWNKLTSEYQACIINNKKIETLRTEQMIGKFSGAPIKISHYMDIMKLLSKEPVLNRLPSPCYILDVGSYLNMFVDFVNRADDDVSSRFIAYGIENSETMCALSRDLGFCGNLIEGDVRFIDELTSVKFDVVIFNNFFHRERPFCSDDIKRVFQSVDNILNRGGLIFYKYDNIAMGLRPLRMEIISKEGNHLKGSDFLPEGFVYSDKTVCNFWYLIKKR